MTEAACKSNYTDERFPITPFSSPPSASFYGSDNNLLPKDRALALQSLNLLESLDSDWNGYGAEKPLRGALLNAKTFIDKLPFPYKVPDQLHTDDEGNIVLIWKESDAQLIITIEMALLHLSYESSRRKPVFRDDVIFDGDTFPEDLKHYIPRRNVNTCSNNIR